MNLDMEMFHQTFFEEAAELLADFEGGLLRLETAPDDLETLNTIFRCAHSIKGGSATFGFTEVAQFTHSLETLLDKVRNGQILVDSGLIQLLLESLDQLKALLEVAQGHASEAPSSLPLLAQMDMVIESVEGGASDADGVLWRVRLRFYPGDDVLQRGANPLFLMEQVAGGGHITSLECDISKLPSLKDMNPETCYLGWNIELLSEKDTAYFHEIFEFVADESVVEISAVDAFAEASGQFDQIAETASVPDTRETAKEAGVFVGNPEAAIAPSKTATVAIASAESHTLRVSTDKVDKLINLVGELVINQSMLNSVIQDFSMAKLPRLIEAVAEMERASRELQERVMSVRMLPIKHAFGRFPRLVRDLAAACGKQIDLQTSGEETELDKTVIESIADPLTHLVRNSIDHGLETPEDRRRAGKGVTGIIALHAFHEGGAIVVEVSDDGRGLDKERILRKAIERGMLSATDPAPSDETIYNYIFHPGFSTAERVTDLSGRGVGMDIVKRAIQGLGGFITVSTTPGQGTRFRVRLPLTMAILEGLSISVGEEVYILPLTSIVESIRPGRGDVRLIAGATEVVMVRQEALPLLRLYQIFRSTPIVTDPTQAIIVVVENEGRKVGLLVDALIGQSQVVIKSLETNYRKVSGIAGATIMGDGRVALIIDVPGLVRVSTGRLEYTSAA